MKTAERAARRRMSPAARRQQIVTLAAELFDRISTQDEFVDFLTLVGYEYLD